MHWPLITVSFVGAAIALVGSISASTDGDRPRVTSTAPVEDRASTSPCQEEGDTDALDRTVRTALEFVRRHPDVPVVLMADSSREIRIVQVPSLRAAPAVRAASGPEGAKAARAVPDLTRVQHVRDIEVTRAP